MEKTVNVDLNKCPDERCECGSPFFTQKTIIKRIPGLMVGKTTNEYMPVQFLACEICGVPHVHTTRLVVPQHETKGKA